MFLRNQAILVGGHKQVQFLDIFSQLFLWQRYLIKCFYQMDNSFHKLNSFDEIE